MSEPSAELQPALAAALRASAPLQAIFGAGPVKVYDIPPTNQAKPYFTVAVSSTPDLAECIDGATARVTVHAWSLTSPPGLREAQQMGAAALEALAALADLPSHRVVTVVPVSAECTPDADGRTAHGAVTVLIHTEPL